MEQPYRLLSPNERMNRYRFMSPSIQEENSADRPNPDEPGRPRLGAKRPRRNYSTDPIQMNNAELQIISSGEIDLNEGMNRYRLMSPPVQEEDSVDRPSLDDPERTRLGAKRPRRNHSTDRQGLTYHSPIQTNNEELQIISFQDRDRYPNRFTQWQADEPQIIITSDVQMQTDDIDCDITEQRPRESTYSAVPVSPQQPQAVFDSNASIPYATNDLPSEPFWTTMIGYERIYDGFSRIDATDRGTQTSPEPYECEDLDLIGPEIINIDSDSSVEIIDLDSDNQQILVKPPSVKPRNRIRINRGSLTTFKIKDSLPPPTRASRLVANRVIKHARNTKTLDFKDTLCPDCKDIPISPVTGSCGHTRCQTCIQNYGSCPCGAEAPTSLHVNPLIQDLIRKILPVDLLRREQDDIEVPAATGANDVAAPSTSKTDGVADRRIRVLYRAAQRAALTLSTQHDIYERMPMSPQIRFQHGKHLVALGQYHEAALHFTRLAVSSEPFAKTARTLLARVITRIIERTAKGRYPSFVARNLFRSLRLQSTASWLCPRDLECILCYQPYTNPVTTPCGHTYCRTCIEQALDYSKVCALCKRSLKQFDLSKIGETKFVTAALEAIDAAKPPLQLDPDVIPIFVCTVAFPSIPCPLFIFHPRYWLMIRRVLESGSRKFGMVAYERNESYSDYGTIMQVCDCVLLEDGRSFLSTIGVSRFRVIESDVRDGCDVARTQALQDIPPSDSIDIMQIRVMGVQVVSKALYWLRSVDDTVRQEIDTAFGPIPLSDDEFSHEKEWWKSPDGPAWLWWLIAILPLRSEIKVLILSTRNLMKRMMAVSRTLDAIDQAAITTTATSECEIRSALTNADEWLERGS